MDFAVNVYPMDLTQEQIDQCNAYVLKLACLPPNITHKELKHIIEETNALFYHIPKSLTTYKNLKYTFLSFEIKDIAKKAYKTYYSLKGICLHWVHPDILLCFFCAVLNHQSKNCNLN